MSLDFSGVTGAVDVTTLLVAITAVAVLKVAPGFARWGYDNLIDWFIDSTNGRFVSNERWEKFQDDMQHRQ